MEAKREGGALTKSRQKEQKQRGGIQDRED